MKEKSISLYENFKKSFVPVIHVTDVESNTYSNIEVCIKAKADGVFLISHGYLNHKELLELGEKVKEKFPSLWVGYNFLDLASKDVFSFLLESKKIVDGIWIDDSYCGINTHEEKAKELVDAWKEYKSLAPDSLYFGGVAFKYCKQPLNLNYAVEKSMECMDIVTTSGSGTGVEASDEKIHTFYNSVSESTKIALASGVSIENIKRYLPYADIFLVASSICDANDMVIEEKALALSQVIHDFKTYEEIQIDTIFWDDSTQMWDTHEGLNTTGHYHVSSHENGWFELIVVEISNGKYYYIENVNCEIKNEFVFEKDNSLNNKLKVYRNESEAIEIAEKLVKKLDYKEKK